MVSDLYLPFLFAGEKKLKTGENMVHVTYLLQGIFKSVGTSVQAASLGRI